jgi:hypothetical protein
VFEVQGGAERKRFEVLAGLPINVHQVGERVNLNFLPFLSYETSGGTGGGISGWTQVVAIEGGLEFEWFVTNDLSVGSFLGIGVQMVNPGDETEESRTSVFTEGVNVTMFGVHYYLP